MYIKIASFFEIILFELTTLHCKLEMEQDLEEQFKALLASDTAVVGAVCLNQVSLN